MSGQFNKISNLRPFSVLSRLWNGPQAVSGHVLEMKLKGILKEHFPSATVIEVGDISGGCGAMFEIVVHDKKFKGLSTVKQHMLINNVLKEEIKDMHGLRIHTSVPS